MLLVPELESPPGSQRQRANQNRLDTDRKDFTSKQIPHWGLLTSFGLGLVPFLGFWHCPSNPEHQQCWKNSDEENPTWILPRHQVSGHAGEQDSDVDTALKNRGDPGSPAFW